LCCSYVLKAVQAIPQINPFARTDFLHEQSMMFHKLNKSLKE
jgi:hypothetical protein